VELSIRDLTIQGNVPTRIGALSNLEFVQITGAALTGTLPTEVGLLTKLRVMILVCSYLCCVEDPMPR
jgi:hypothetical protein